MFSNFNLGTLRPRARSFSSQGKKDSEEKPPKTPVGSPKEKRNRKSFLFRRGKSDLGSSPSISSLRPGSVAISSDQLMPGDRIQSINGINTVKMRCSDVSSLLENIDGNALLEIGYSLPSHSSQNSLSVHTKVADVTIERIDGSLGITLRGGTIPERPDLSRPLIVTHVRPQGPAARSGLIRVGDRILKVDHQSLIHRTLPEAQNMLRAYSRHSDGHNLTTLTIEYDVSNMESVKYASGPLLVEIDRSFEENFGLILTNCNNFTEQDEISCVGFYIDHIIPGSTADRCGALGVGDQVLAIDDLELDNYSGTTSDAEVLLRRARKLQILPCHVIQMQSSVNYGYNQTYNTINSRRSRRKMMSSRQSSSHKSFESDNSNCIGYNNVGINHCENVSLTLYSENGKGFGFTVAPGDSNDHGTNSIVVSRILPNSPAFRSGCLQAGDRIIAVNHQINYTIQEINSILECGNDIPNRQLILQVEFDVSDNIEPTSGIFTVKLAKRGSGLGITITASKSSIDEPFIISEIRRGSVAHRSGILHAGDRLLSIDNRPLNQLTIESAFDILHNTANEIVTLKVEKTETENLSLDSVVYTVELHRYGGPLGITISGSEDCSEPIVLSRISEGGLADKTGALHVGDIILAINGENLEHKRLSDAIRLLQSSGDRVQLKISRNIKPLLTTDYSSETLNQENYRISDLDDRCNYSSPDGVMSVDSAVHSWDSNHAENNEQNEPKYEESLISEPVSLPYHGKDIHERTDSHLQFYSDAEDIFCPSPLPLPNYNYPNVLRYERTFINNYYGTRPSVPSPHLSSSETLGSNGNVFHVTLFKDSIYDDYGFSLSDGLYEKGVYVNKIRKDGPADIVGLLKPFDRIIQVNDIKTVDYDCCLTVPLIASSGDRIELVISRTANLCNTTKENDFQDYQKNTFSSSQSTIIKTL